MSSVGILEDLNSWSNELVTLITMREPNTDIICFSNVDDAIRAVAEEDYLPDVWLVDLMMSTGSIFNDAETDSGRATGERFIIDFLKLGESNGPMILVHSQRSGVSALPTMHPRLIYMPKAEFPSIRVAEQVIDLLKADD